MLKRLSINNYALIENSEVDFSMGFTVITGETGSGKSIMLDALSLLSGTRADSRAMGDKAKKTVVEARFNPDDAEMKTVLDNHSLDWDDEGIVIRREIAPSGKSRGFVNDTPVTVAVLSEITSRLLDIHSQHNNALLNNSKKQLEIIDTYAGNELLKSEFREKFQSYVTLRNKIKQQREKQEKDKDNRDFILFRLEQLDKVKPKSGELASLEKEYEMLSDADRLKSELSEAYGYLDSNNASALKNLHEASNCIGRIDLSLFDEGEGNDLAERLESMKIEVRDLSDTLLSYIDMIDSNPERLEKIKSRIDVLYEAMKRLKVKDEEELVKLHETLKKELLRITEGGSDLKEWENQLKREAGVLKGLADALTETRIKAARQFSDTLMEKVRPLGLPNVKFEVRINKGKISADGQDEVSFYCSFNKKKELQPLSEIASGGEISRVMLGIKYMMAEKMSLPTVIFDEIDSGVSGDIAHRMAMMMKEMSKNMQVFAVTHLPQVAAAGDYHFKVFKNDREDKTVSNIDLLDSNGRVQEIASMLSGAEINDAAVDNAKMLLHYH